MNIQLEDINKDIEINVTAALKEDLGDAGLKEGDITAQLIPAAQHDVAEVITREDCVVCGIPWFNETFKQVEGVGTIEWLVKEGQEVKANQVLVRLSGNSRALLTGERTALNFLQMLSGTATLAKHYAKTLGDSSMTLLDTRKTIPGLRIAQKYAVSVGGCHNHRIGLYDAFLIKENHIAACGGIEQAIQTAQKNEPNKTIEIEVETLEELQRAINAGAHIVMLDNFTKDMLENVRCMDLKNTKLEYSGNLTIDNIDFAKQYPLDFVSFGALTKHVRAIDLSFKIK